MENDIQEALSNAEAVISKDLTEHPLRFVIIVGVVAAICGFLLGASVKR